MKGALVERHQQQAQILSKCGRDVDKVIDNTRTPAYRVERHSWMICISCMLETTGLDRMMASPCSTRPKVLPSSSTTSMIRCYLLRWGWFRRLKSALQAIQGYHVVASILAVRLIVNLGDSPPLADWLFHRRRIAGGACILFLLEMPTTSGIVLLH